jgi:hypothetical protein
MAHTLFELCIIHTGKLRSSSAPIPNCCSDICRAFPFTAPTGAGHAEHHTQSLLPTGTGYPATKLDPWVLYSALDCGPYPNSRVRAPLLGLHNPRTADASRTRCGIIDPSFSFASSVDTHPRLSVDDQHSPRRATAPDNSSNQFVLVRCLPAGRNSQGPTMVGRNVYICVLSENTALGGCSCSNPKLEVPPLS